MTVEYAGRVDTSEVVTFRQTLMFDDYEFTFTGSTSNTGQIRMRRESDKKYWDGSSWVSSESWVSTTVSAANKEHTYDMTFPSTMANDEVEVTMRVNADPATEDVARVGVGGESVGSEFQLSFG